VVLEAPICRNRHLTSAESKVGEHATRAAEHIRFRKFHPALIESNPASSDELESRDSICGLALMKSPRPERDFDHQH